MISIRLCLVAAAAVAAIAAGCSSSGGATSKPIAETRPAAATPAADAVTLDAADSRPIAADSATLGVRGMSCPKCANNIRLQLESVAGVGDINIDMGKGDVRVGFVGPVRPSAAQLAAAVERTGFTLVSIQTP